MDLSNMKLKSSNHRMNPYIWVTWLAAVMSGDNLCHWQAWFQTHNQLLKKADGGFDLTKWRIEHTKMLTELKSTLHAEKPDATVIIERDLKFIYKNGITLAGKPDCVFVDGRKVTVFDCKTGKERAKDAVQVMLYQWMLMSIPSYANSVFTGSLVYRGQGRKTVTPPSQDTQETIHYFLELLGGSKEAEKVPGSACRWCPITKEDCPDRVESVQSDYEEPF